MRSLILCEPLAIWYGQLFSIVGRKVTKNEQMMKFRIYVLIRLI